MKRTSIPVILVILCAVTASLGGSETIRLPNGESVELAHPGVDGVAPPAIVEGTGVAPAFPDRADPDGEDSQVTVAILVRDDGTVGHAEVLSALHPGLGFEESALEAVNQWQYRPALFGDLPVNSYHVVRLKFRAPGAGFSPGLEADAHMLRSRSRLDGSPTVLVRGQQVLSRMPHGWQPVNHTASASWPTYPGGTNSRTPTAVNMNRPCLGGLCGTPTRASEFWSVQPVRSSETPTPMPRTGTGTSSGRPAKK